MKILVEDSVQNVMARDLGFYLGEDSHHKASNALNDIPSVEWVAGYPAKLQTIDYDPNTLMISISEEFVVSGIGGLSSFYVGKFHGDLIQMSLEHNVKSDKTVDNLDYPFSSHDDFLATGAFGEINIPIRVYNTLSDFVRGRFIRYHDYFKTFDELSLQAFYHETDPLTGLRQSTPVSIQNGYIQRPYEMKLTFRNMNSIVTTTAGSANNLLFALESEEKVSGFSESISSTLFEYWKISGHLEDGLGNPVSINDAKVFLEEIKVGCYLIGNPNTGTPQDLFQLIRIKGDGTKTNSLTLLYRKPKGSTDGIPVATKKTGSLYEIYSVLPSIRLGLLRVGFSEEFPNAQVGLSKSYKDYSVRTELVNGGHQYINRNIAKSYNGSMVLNRERLVKFLKFAEKQRAKPFPVEILTRMEEEFPTSMFGVFDSSPDENMSYRTGEMRDINFTIRQIY